MVQALASAGLSSTLRSHKPSFVSSTSRSHPTVPNTVQLPARHVQDGLTPGGDLH